MFGLGMSEIILLAIMALIIIGPKQLPEVARNLARFINELKRSTEDLKEEFKKQAIGDLELSNYLKQQSEILPPPVASGHTEEPLSESTATDSGESVEQLVFENTEISKSVPVKKDGNSEG